MMTSLLFIPLAAALYALISFLVFQDGNDGISKYSFFGTESWRRKYKRNPSRGILSSYDFYLAPNNWYYRLFAIRYREAFPLSATVFVFVTDGYHLVQWFFIKVILLGVCLRYDVDNGWHFNIWEFITLWALWLGAFNVVYTYFKKK